MKNNIENKINSILADDNIFDTDERLTTRFTGIYVVDKRLLRHSILSLIKSEKLALLDRVEREIPKQDDRTPISDSAMSYQNAWNDVLLEIDKAIKQIKKELES